MIIAQELTKEDLAAFINVTEHKYNTAHSILCFAIIKRIHRRVLMGHRFGAIKVCHSKCLVVDGNHRYIAYALAGIDIEVIPGTSSHCDKLNTFNNIKIDDVQDWDMNCPKNKKFCNDDFLKNLD
uniref:hypothetical protein n=1 Tax=Pedobacter schmidteae TaxID=2201271 RepID=UPI000EB26E4E|nr:hypothetical protein [Pedobacter schmidteae]